MIILLSSDVMVVTAPRACPGMFQCKKSGLCIEYDLYCNGHYNCFDGSDEENCDETVSIFNFTVTSITSTSATFSWTSSKPSKSISYIIQHL